MEKQTFTVSHSGKQHSYHLAKALLDLGRLQGFYTSSYVSPAFLQELILASGNQFFSRRFKEGLAAPFVHPHWSFELKEFITRKLEGKSAKVQDLVYQRDVDFDRMMAQKLKSIKSSHFWGFQGSCHDSLIAAKECGKVVICELATAHVVQARKILAEEARLQPEWADSIDNLYFPAAYEKRLEEEPVRADRVIAASEFTKWTLTESGIPASKISVLPLGFEADKIQFTPGEKGFEKRPLRLLYAGTVTQRKGISYLLEAMSQLSPSDSVELHIVGGVQGLGTSFHKQASLYKHRPAVSQSEMFGLYGGFDALVLPTVFEGFGLVIVEAMAAGLPVITTSHSMGPDVVEQGKNGWIVPIRDAQSLKDSILKLRNLSDAEYLEMRQSARDAALGFTWDGFRENLKGVIEGF